MKKSKYPKDLGALLYPSHLMWVYRYLLRNGRVKIVATVKGQVVDKHTTSAPMLWAEVCRVDRPVVLAELRHLITSQMAEAAWWDRVQAGDAAALEEHAWRFGGDDNSPAGFLEERHAQSVAATFGKQAAELRQAAQDDQDRLNVYQSLPEKFETLVLRWHRRPCKPSPIGLAGLNVDVIMVSTRPELDHLIPGET